MKLQPHVSFALAYASGPLLVKTDFQPITTNDLILGGFHFEDHMG